MAKINKTKSGAYRTRVYIGKDESGKKHWKSFTDRDKDRLKMVAGRYGNIVREYAQSQTIEGCIRAYISAKTAFISPSTVRAYKSMLSTLNSEYGAFMAYDAASLKKQMYQDFILALKAAGKSTKYIRNIKSLIDASLKYADLPVPAVMVPPSTQKPYALPDDDNIQKVIDYAAAHNHDDVLLALYLALYCGLRRSEICALEVSDFRDNRLHINKALVHTSTNEWTLKSTKTAQSARVIVVPDCAAALIAGREGRLIPCNPDALRNRLNRIIKFAKAKPFGFHSLRHKFASNLVLAGVPDTYSEYLGGWKHGSRVLKTVYQNAEQKKAEEMLVNSWGKKVNFSVNCVNFFSV